MFLPFLKGLSILTANIEHLFNNPKLRSFCYPLRAKRISHDSSFHPASWRKESERARIKRLVYKALKVKVLRRKFVVILSKREIVDE